MSVPEIMQTGRRWNGHPDLTWRSRQVLLEHGAEVKTSDDDTRPIQLCQACADGNVEAVDILLKHGTDVNVSDNSNLMPIHQASRIEMWRSSSSS